MKKGQIENWRRTLKHQKRARSKAGSHNFFSGVHVATFFIYEFIYWDRSPSSDGLLTETTLLITFQYGLSIRPSKGTWPGRSESRRKAFPSFSLPQFPPSWKVWYSGPFYVWCPLISNPDPTVQLLQPRRRARTGYKSRWSWTYEWYTYEKEYCWYDSVKNICKKRNSCTLSDQIRQSTGNL